MGTGFHITLNLLRVFHELGHNSRVLHLLFEITTTNNEHPQDETRRSQIKGKYFSLRI